MSIRQSGGSVVCRSCGMLVGVNDETCYHCGASHPGLWGFGPALRALGSDLGFTSIIIWGCAALYLVALALDPSHIGMNGLFGLLAPSGRASLRLGMSGAIPVFGFGHWWTVLSAGWLHGSLLHILFNLMWVRQLAPLTADIYGAGRTVIIYTIATVVGFTLSSLAGLLLGPLPLIGGAPYTLGASASIFGLLGALVYAGRRGIASHISSQALTFAIILFVFGFMMARVDNWAHAGGFLGGYLGGAFLNPLLPERLNHLAAAAACLLLTALAVVLSLATT